MQKNIELSTEPQGRQPSEEEEELDFSINILAESQERELNGDIEIPSNCKTRKSEKPDRRLGY